MRPFYKLRHVGKFLFKLTGTANGHYWRVSIKKFCRLKVLLIRFFSSSGVGHIFACVCEVGLRFCVKNNERSEYSYIVLLTFSVFFCSVHFGFSRFDF